MSKVYSTCTIQVTNVNEPEGDTLEVEIEGTGDYGNMGIGPYEYWGQKCNDVQMGVEFDEVGWDESLYSEEQNKVIQIYVDKNSDKIDTMLHENINE